MTPHTATIFVSVVLILASGVYAGFGWSRRQSRRALLRGSGGALIVLGLWVGGVMSLLFNGLQSLLRWYRSQFPFTVISWIAIAFLISGALLFVIGNFFSPVTRDMAKQRQNKTTPFETIRMAPLKTQSTAQPSTLPNDNSQG